MSKNRMYSWHCLESHGLTYHSVTADDKPIKSLDIAKVFNGDGPSSPIPRKLKPSRLSTEMANGLALQMNGSAILSNGSGVKRSAAEALGDETTSGKKTKQDPKENGDAILVDDVGDGAILIDDD